MQKKTSSKEFLKYGNVYDAPIDAEKNNMTSTIFSIQAKNSISQLHCFDSPVYIEMQSGMSCILPCKAILTDNIVYRTLPRLSNCESFFHRLSIFTQVN